MQQWTEAVWHLAPRSNRTHISCIQRIQCNSIRLSTVHALTWHDNKNNAHTCVHFHNDTSQTNTLKQVATTAITSHHYQSCLVSLTQPYYSSNRTRIWENYIFTSSNPGAVTSTNRTASVTVCQDISIGHTEVAIKQFKILCTGVSTSAGASATTIDQSHDISIMDPNALLLTTSLWRCSTYRRMARHYPGLGPSMHIHDSRGLTLIQQTRFYWISVKSHELSICIQGSKPG
jgi:hypothetical protein